MAKLEKGQGSEREQELQLQLIGQVNAFIHDQYDSRVDLDMRDIAKIITTYTEWKRAAIQTKMPVDQIMGFQNDLYNKILDFKSISNQMSTAGDDSLRGASFLHGH